jgi:hypothetical protein
MFKLISTRNYPLLALLYFAFYSAPTTAQLSLSVSSEGVVEVRQVEPDFYLLHHPQEWRKYYPQNSPTEKNFYFEPDLSIYQATKPFPFTQIIRDFEQVDTNKSSENHIFVEGSFWDGQWHRNDRCFVRASLKYKKQQLRSLRIYPSPSVESSVQCFDSLDVKWKYRYKNGRLKEVKIDGKSFTRIKRRENGDIESYVSSLTKTNPEKLKLVIEAELNTERANQIYDYNLNKLLYYSFEADKITSCLAYQPNWPPGRLSLVYNEFDQVISFSEYWDGDARTRIEITFNYHPQGGQLKAIEHLVFGDSGANDIESKEVFEYSYRASKMIKIIHKEWDSHRWDNVFYEGPPTKISEQNL